MILDRRVLDPTEVPDQELIVHRAREFEDLREALRLLGESADRSSFLTLYGPPGTGKTLITKRVLSELAAESHDTAYVDCWEHYSEYHCLFDIVQDLETRSVVGVVHRNSTPTAELTAELEREPEQRRVVVLDEAEMIQASSVFRLLQEAPKTDVVCIVNDTTELRDGHDDDVRRALNLATELHLGPYHIAELQAILEARAAHGIDQGTVRDRALERIAVQVEGDARLGIAALREAAQTAVETRRDVIGVEHVEAAVTNAARWLHQQALDRLSEHQRSLYDLLRDHGGLAPKALYERYQDAVEAPKSRRTMDTWLSKMDHYGIVTAHGTSRDREYRAGGRKYDPQTA